MQLADGVPYLYGVCKTKKRTWRPIAGVSTSAGSQRQVGPRHPFQTLAEGIMKALQCVLRTLEAADRLRMQQQGLRAFWVVRSPQEFAAWVRTYLRELSSRLDPFELPILRTCTPTYRTKSS